MTTIRLENITMRYDHKQVFENMTLSIFGKGITCILGGTGCGKTTLLRLIAGLERPDAGKIFLDDILVTDQQKILLPAYKRNIGFVFQDLALWPHFTVYRHLTWVLKKRGQRNVDAQASDFLREIALDEHKNKYPHQLSGGQQQLLAMARAWIIQPHILLMDEPLTHLDILIKRRMIGQLIKLKKQRGTTVVYVTHDINEAALLADHLILFGDDGKVILSGKKEDVLSSDHPYMREWVNFSVQSILPLNR